MFNRLLILELACLGSMASECSGEVYRWTERPAGRPNFQGSGFAELPDGRLAVMDHDGAFAFDGMRLTRIATASWTVRAIFAETDGAFLIAGEGGVVRQSGGRTEGLFAHRLSDMVRIGSVWIGVVATPHAGPRLAQLFPGKSQWTHRDLLKEDVESRLGLSKDGVIYFTVPGRICSVRVSADSPSVDCVAEPRLPSGMQQIQYLLRSATGTIWGRDHSSILSLADAAKIRLIQNVGSRSSSNLVERIPGEVCGVFGPNVRCWDDEHEYSYPLPRGVDVSAVSCYASGDGTLWVSQAGYGLYGLAIHREVNQNSFDRGLTGAIFDTLRLSDGSILAAGPAGLQIQTRTGEKWVDWGDGMARAKSMRIRRNGERIGVVMPGVGLRVFDLKGKFRSGVEDFGSSDGRLASTGQFLDASEWLIGGRGGLYASIQGKGRKTPLPREGAVKDLDRLNDGSFAIASTSGLAIGRPGAWRQYDETNGLRSAALQSVYGEVDVKSGTGEFWVGYDLPLGFARLQTSGMRTTVTNYGVAEGFDDLATFDLLRGAKGVLWRGGLRGIYLSDGKTFDPNDWYAWNAKSGLTNPDEAMNSMRLDGEGAVMMGTAGGLVRIEPPADLLTRNYPVRSFISRVEVNGSEVNGGAALRLDRPDLRVALELSQLNLMAEPQLSYEYRLVPGSDSWKRVTENKFLLESVPSGRQRLELRARKTRFVTPVNVAVLEIESPLGWGAIAARASWGLSILVLATAGWHWGWVLLAWAPIGRWRRRAEKAIFLQLRSCNASGRRRGLWALPKELRSRLTGMLSRYESEGDPKAGPPALLDGRYVLEHPVAKGGSATVYFARDLQSSEAVAVKLFHRKPREGTWHWRKLKEEISSLKRVAHRGIVRLLDAGENDEGLPYLVMEYIAGTTLRQELRSGSMHAARAEARFGEMLEALVAVHEQGILHRDLKPENVMIRNAHSAEEHAVLIDFGVAYVYDALRAEGDSTYEAWTPGYAAPEQTAGYKTPASDVYSIALVGFEMLTGVRFRQAVVPGGGRGAIQAAMEKHEVTDASEWADLFARGTELEYSKRIQTAAEFLAVARAIRN